MALPYLNMRLQFNKEAKKRKIENIRDIQVFCFFYIKS